MNKQLSYLLITSIIILSFIGIITNFFQIIHMIVISVATILIIYFTYKLLTRQKKSAKEKRNYNKAVKQSKNLYNFTTKNESKNNSKKNGKDRAIGKQKLKKKTDNSHLTVIDGKKHSN